MSKFNALTLSGFVFTKPTTVSVGESGIYKKAVTFDMTIERLNMNRIDVLTVKCYDDIADKALKLKKGDYIVTDNAVLRTTNYKRVVECICPQCHSLETKELNSERTEIIINDFAAIPHARPESIEGVNRMILLGNVCTPLSEYKVGSDKAQVQFKMAVDRSGSLKKLQHADYPFIRCYGYEANYAYENFNVGSLLLVDGCITQRRITQTFETLCPECDTRYTKEVENLITEGLGVKIQQFKHAETRSTEEILERKEEDIEGMITFNDVRKKELKADDEYEENIKDIELNDEEMEDDVFDILAMFDETED